MKTVFFLLLRLICYPALLLLSAAAIALLIVSVNGQCPPMNDAAVNDFNITCATKFSEGIANFGLTVAAVSLDSGVPIVLAVGGLIFLLRDLRRLLSRAPS